MIIRKQLYCTDMIIGKLDRLLSEFLVQCAMDALDEADVQTLKHHADDLIGVGNRALELIKERLDGTN